MRLNFRHLAGLALLLSLADCSLAPTYRRPDLPIAKAWPAATSEPADVAPPAWRDMFPDKNLQTLITLALAQNRDLRIALGDVQKARAQYGVQRSALLPSVELAGTQSKVRTPASVSLTGRALTSTEYAASVGFTAYELDLFGRVRSQADAARQTYLAVAEDRRTTQISLIAQVVDFDLQLAADLELLSLARDTYKVREENVRIIGLRFDHGAVSQLDLSQAVGLAQQARSDIAAASARVEKDRNALRLVVGADIPAALEPNAGLAAVLIRRDLGVGMPSTVITQRPDVLSAEHALRAQNANIGAARAAFLPQIALTGSAGQESVALGALFNGANRAWSFTPKVTLPIFTGGANLAGLDLAKAGRKIAVAQYEKAIQTAFREVADQLAVRASVEEELAAQREQVRAAEVALKLSKARFDRGLDSYLQYLDAQRSLYAAEQTLVATEFAETSNRVDLYKALGGGG